MRTLEDIRNDNKRQDLLLVGMENECDGVIVDSEVNEVKGFLENVKRVFGRINGGKYE